MRPEDYLNAGVFPARSGYNIHDGFAAEKQAEGKTYYSLRALSSNTAMLFPGAGVGTDRRGGTKFATLNELLVAVRDKGAVIQWCGPFQIVRVTEEVTPGEPEVSADLTPVDGAEYVIQLVHGHFISERTERGTLFGNGCSSVSCALRFQSEVAALEAISGDVRFRGDYVGIRRVTPGKSTTKVTETVLR